MQSTITVLVQILYYATILCLDISTTLSDIYIQTGWCEKKLVFCDSLEDCSIGSLCILIDLTFSVCFQK